MKGGYKMDAIPIRERLLLTLTQAAEYANLGVNKMRSISDENDKMTVFVGNKRMIKREELENFINEAIYSI